MKKFIAATLLTLPALAAAENLVLSGTAAQACTFSGTTTGALTVSGTSISTATPATTVVTNNDPNFYKVTVGTVSGLTTAPSGMSLTGNMILTPSVSSGSNSGATFTGTDAIGKEANLALASADTISVSLSGTLNGAALAGAYSATSAVTCIAQ